MYYAMQLALYVDIYDVATPANVVIFQEQFQNMIEFKALNPEGGVKLFIPEFKLMDWIKGQKTLIVINPDQNASPMQDMIVYIVIASAGLVFIIVLAVIAFAVKKYKDKIKEKLGALKSKLVWNGILRSMSVSYF